MIFPIGDENIKGGHKPIVAYSFLGINILIFIFQFAMSPEQCEIFVFSYGTIPNEISNGEDYHTLLTSMFLHGGWMHLIGNMLFLWIFGDNIEAIIGSFWFLLFYLLGGLTASFTHIIIDADSLIPVVGASGAISAIMGTYLVLFPKSKIKLIFIIFFTTFYIPAFLFLGIWFVQQLFSGIGSIGPTTAEEGGGVAWWAHIGGFIFGVLVGFFIKLKMKTKILQNTV